jgi:riboflavin biosynthesis pyrimidine reductase
VVVDPGLRSAGDCTLFHDGAAPTVVICARGCERKPGVCGQAEIIEVEAEGSVLAPSAILHALRQRGLRRIFIEGGGLTVTHFLQAGAVKRLHVTVSPIFLGQGRPGLALPKIDALDQALRPRVRRFAMGNDVLFDCSF